MKQTVNFLIQVILDHTTSYLHYGIIRSTVSTDLIKYSHLTQDGQRYTALRAQLITIVIELFIYSTCLLQIIKQNESIFTQHEILNANKARKLQEVIGWPSDSTYKPIITNGHINNFPITINNVTCTSHIYDPAIPLLKGKMTRKNPVNPTQPTLPFRLSSSTNTHPYNYILISSM